MDPPVDILSRRAYLFILTGFLVFLTIPLLFFQTGPVQTFKGWAEARLDTHPAKPPPHHDKSNASLPQYYEWQTKTAFSLVNSSDARNAPPAELCKSFPVHLLEHIQPVLKTGHATLHERVIPQLQTVSACLHNLVIFSDLRETVEGHDVIDILADIPDHLAESELGATQLLPYANLLDFDGNGTLNQVDMKEFKGWRLDKFKFLLQISRIWRISPGKQWYVFFEDDTYVFWDNVFRLLEQFDPNETHYFGSPSPAGKNKEGVREWFANGGPGYILSRAAMQELVKADWDSEGNYLGPKLLERYWNRLMRDCCGDSVLGAALRNRRIELSGLWPMFGTRRPHRLPFSEEYWCQPPLTMHKPSEEEVRGLWRWEWEQRQGRRPLIFRDIAASYLNITDLTSRSDWDNAHKSTFKAPSRNQYYSHDPHQSSEACQAACELLPDCMQWTYHLRKCNFDESFRYGEQREPALGKVGQEWNKSFNATQALKWSNEDMRYHSGWMSERMKMWIDQRPCEHVKWLRAVPIRTF